MDILKGVKVIDVTAYAFVPAAGGILGHWGADVIHVESTTAPDPMRLVGGFSAEPGASSPVFKHYSRGKRSIALNLATPEGQEILYRLAKDADVFLTSYLPSTRKKLKIDVADIRRINPKIVYVRGSGYGPKGPDAERPGYDSISWWYRGSLGQTAMDASGAEWPVGMTGHGDGMSGMVLAGGICAALLHRALTGEAKVVDSSLMGTAIWFNGLELIGAQGIRLPGRPGSQRKKPGPVKRPQPIAGGAGGMGGATMALYQTRDYRFVNLLFLGDDDRDYADFCACISRPELGADPRFAKAKDRQANAGVLGEIFEDLFASKDLAEWRELLAKARGAWSVVQTPEETLEDPQTIANGYMRHVDYPDGGFRLPTPPIGFDEDTGDVPRAPDFAEHTDEILREIGCGSDDIARYKSAGAVVQG